MNMVNKPGDLSTPLCELMAMDFVIRELNLYLDTHPDDREAFETLQKVHSPERRGAASGTWSSMAPFRCGIWKARTSMTGSTRLGRGSRKERKVSDVCL